MPEFKLILPSFSNDNLELIPLSSLKHKEIPPSIPIVKLKLRESNLLVNNN